MALSLFEQFYGKPGTIKAVVPEPDMQEVARDELVSGNLFGLPSQKPEGKVLWKPPQAKSTDDTPEAGDGGGGGGATPAEDAETAVAAEAQPSTAAAAPAPPEPQASAMTQEAKKELEQKLLSALFAQEMQVEPPQETPVVQPPQEQQPQMPAASSASVVAEAEEDLSKLSVKDLKRRLLEAGASMPPGPFEKSDLVQILRDALAAKGASGSGGGEGGQDDIQKGGVASGVPTAAAAAPSSSSTAAAGPPPGKKAKIYI